ncbi:MAG: FecR domain-containing protein [Burkholderiales bacterium]|nr:FecR domain-containing protein [Burkholderiales bacterium]MCW5603345.1 FecR domain-containing protein [Burkholderiales bacterium]
MPADAVERALTLIARMHGGDGARAGQARDELAAWRRAAPENEMAFHEADRRWKAIGGLAPDLRGVLPEPRKARRTGQVASKAGLVLGLLLAIGLLLRGYLALPLYERELMTAVAQTAGLELPDGSRLSLDARTRLQVVFFLGSRSVRLGSGEAYFDVAADAARPFIVDTRQGRVSVLGTAFTVRDRGGAVTVSVKRGRVAVAPSGAAAKPVELTAGQRVIIADGQAGEPEPALAQAAPWRSGWLVFDDIPLAEALQSINAYRRAPVSLADARAGAERLTGSFRIRDPEAVLDLLPKVLPVEVRRAGDGTAAVMSRRP